ncbi:response regulator transcription factor [Metabacillus endolithicus]|uniref:Response regulator transcription factor n=1 Tax=Metabacillus endolithicus TaxID=1535204 RepID=A0ABW5C7P1_9BACI|nr:response regulator transcription factor [Metabacillus endolithicus]UPG61873.1 response regulator transcription factor [Metabacillus endolithicus]
MQEANILLVDDETSIVKMVEMVLNKEGFINIFKAYTAREALEIVQQQDIDYIVLDVMLPDLSGFDLCPKIRDISNAYILFLTAKVSDLDVLTGFAIGGDDYVTKPFNPLEIAARIKATLKRRNLPARTSFNDQVKSGNTFDYKGFVVDVDAGELLVKGKVVPCPAQAFLLLIYFCQNPNIVISKQQLLETVWGYDRFVDDNTVTVHIHKLRERIEEDPSNPKYLKTVRGLGYKLVKEKDV